MNPLQTETCLLTIESEISYLASHIREYHSSLNQESIWLFLATLGCWSVTNVPIQLAALAVTFLFFTHRTLSGFSDKRSFAEIVKTIQARIDQQLATSDEAKARLYDLAQVQSDSLSYKALLRNGWVFGVSLMFYGVSASWLIARSAGAT